MNAVNAVPLLILVWTFTAVCEVDDDDISVICEDVTGAVGKEVTLTCSVSLSLKCTGRYIKLYKFYYSENFTYRVICRREFPRDSYEQRNITCSFTPTTAMTRQFKFFVQPKCGWKNIAFTVNITEPSKPESDTEALPKQEPKEGASPGSRTGDNTRSEEGSGSNNTIITAVMGCFIIIIILIITVIYKTKLNYNKPCGMQKKMLLDEIHDEDNRNCPVNVI